MGKKRAMGLVARSVIGCAALFGAGHPGIALQVPILEPAGQGAAASPEGALETFEAVELEEDGTLVSPLGVFAPAGDASLAILASPGGGLALRLPGGSGQVTELRFSEPLPAGATVAFSLRRDGKRRPFAAAFTAIAPDGSELIADASEISADEDHGFTLAAPLGLTGIRFEITAPAARGVLIDDLLVEPPAPMVLLGARFEPVQRPLVQGESCLAGELVVETRHALEPLCLRAPVFRPGDKNPADQGHGLTWEGFQVGGLGAQPAPDPEGAGGELELEPGVTRFPVVVSCRAGGVAVQPALLSRGTFEFQVQIGDQVRRFQCQGRPGNRGYWLASRVADASRTIEAVSLVAAGAIDMESGVGTRLACAVSTDEGVLLRTSDDAGQSWGPPVDLDSELGSRLPELRRASLIQDSVRKLVHLVGQNDSGAFVYATSADGGAHWALQEGVLDGLDPSTVRITGVSGTQLAAGDLVIPVIRLGAFRIEDEPCAALLSSTNFGRSWNLSSSPLPNTTTASAVEIGDGAVILNMTDGRGGKRNEWVTQDLGETWTNLSGRRTRLRPSAGADASVIHIARAQGTGADGRLLMANAETSRKPPRDMTLVGSGSNGDSWPAEYRQILDDGVFVDHPSLVLFGREVAVVAYRPSCGGVVVQAAWVAESVPKVLSIFDLGPGADFKVPGDK